MHGAFNTKLNSKEVLILVILIYRNGIISVFECYNLREHAPSLLKIKNSILTRHFDISGILLLNPSYYRCEAQYSY